MKRKNLINVSKRIMAGCLSVAMILTGILVLPKEANATTETTKAVHFDSSYTMNEYWKSSTDIKAPVKAGYVFGGWFEAAEEGTKGAEKDAEGNCYAPLKSVIAAKEGAVAKFVPAEVLSIKIQVGTLTDEATNTTTTSMRILSTVDSTNYQAVGFQYKLAANDTAWTENITKVYSGIRPYKGAPAEDTMYPGDKFVADVSKYFIAADVSSISKEGEEKIVYARPFWITMDGTKVVGLARNNRVVDYNNGYTCVGINLLTDGKASAMVAAGKIQVTYNTAFYDVVGTDITADATAGGTYLFPEMECHVDDATGTITFVGNADDVTTDLLADGLFANVKFKKTEANTTNIALDFKINAQATEFCNWAEADVDAFVVQ